MQMRSTFLRVIDSRSSSILGARDMTLDNIIDGTNKVGERTSYGGFVLATLIQFKALCFKLRLLPTDLVDGKVLRTVILVGIVIVVTTPLTSSVTGTGDTTLTGYGGLFKRERWEEALEFPSMVLERGEGALGKEEEPLEFSSLVLENMEVAMDTGGSLGTVEEG